MNSLIFRLAAVLTFAISFVSQASIIFINELHYDNTGSDTNEFIEIAGTSGTDLSGWSLELYNGNTGLRYQKKLFGNKVLTNQNNGYGFASLDFSGMQNGAPDGIALVDNSERLIQFLSYEGEFIAQNGAAKNIVSQDIGMSEGANTPTGWSLQLTGVGNNYNDYSWHAAQHTKGATNLGQQFNLNSKPPVTKVDEPNNYILMLLSVLLLPVTRLRYRKPLINDTVNN